MKRKLLCIGGTGQMVLHYYMQLYLLGAITEPFEAVVIDTDEVIGSIQVTREFLSDLQYGEEKFAALGGRVPVINHIHVKPPPADNAFEALTGHKNVETIQPHPAQAFFSRDSLNQDLFKGLFARPALSSVVIQSELHDPHNRARLKPESQSTVVIVGSLIGGTGGGLMAPIIDAVASDCRRERIEHVKIRAVLFGEYFCPEPGRVENAARRFKSNQVFVLRATKEALEELHSYCIMGGPGEPLIQRNPEQEREGKNIPWPKEEAHPLWKGAQAVEYLCKETTIDKRKEFADREIAKFDHPVPLEEAKRLWRIRLSAADTFVQKKVVTKASRDPLAKWIWGREFVDILAHFWDLAAAREGGWKKAKEFPRKLQRSLKIVWEGEAERAGLRSIFPELTGPQKVRPREFKRISWPQVKEGHRYEKLFTDSDTIARKAAATLLYWILRGGM